MAVTTVNLDPDGINLNATFKQGSTFKKINLVWKTGEEGEEQLPVDLTGHTARMQIRWAAAACGEPLLSLTDEDGIELGGEEGSIKVTITAEQSAALPAGKLVYDLEVVSPSGEVTAIAWGTLNVLGNVTK